MNKKIRESGRRQLKKYTHKLLESLEDQSDLPPIVIASRVSAVLRSAFVYCPEELAQNMAESLHHLFCNWHEICGGCGEKHPRSELTLTLAGCLCPPCLKKLEEDRLK